ncbi:hypothetical protein JW872_03930 [Candidatus Babeliales bacterium]|nr:hypothetical protein [Candidatus Babeliales bacterium]
MRYAIKIISFILLYSSGVYATSYLFSSKIIIELSSDKEPLTQEVCDLVADVCTKHNIEYLEFEHVSPALSARWHDPHEPFFMIGSSKLVVNPSVLDLYSVQEQWTCLVLALTQLRQSTTMSVVGGLLVLPLLHWYGLKKKFLFVVWPLLVCAMNRARVRYGDYRIAAEIQDVPAYLAYLTRRAILAEEGKNQSWLLTRLLSGLYGRMPSWTQRAQSLQSSYKYLHPESTIHSE